MPQYSHHRHSVLNLPSGVIFNPRDISLQAMMTLLAEDTRETYRVLEVLHCIDREDITGFWFLTDYMSQQGTIFQRNIFLFIRTILEVHRKYTWNGFHGFWDRCSDITRGFDWVEWLWEFIKCLEQPESDSTIHFTLHTEHPIDVCWDLQNEETILKLDDYLVRHDVGWKMSFLPVSEIFAKRDLGGSWVNFLYPLWYRGMTLPFFCVSEVHVRNPLGPSSTRVLQLLESDISKPLDPA